MRMVKRVWVVLFVCVVVCLTGTTVADEPATVADAAAILDLSEFPLIEPVNETNVQNVTRQEYQAGIGLLQLAEKLRKHLKDKGCQELDGAMFVDAYGSAMFTKGKFVWSLTLMPGAMPGQTSVSIVNHGNVTPQTLPTIDGLKMLYAGPNSIIYTSQSPAAEVTETYRKKWTAEGWVSHGDTAVSFFMKKNAVRAQVMISKAPPNSEHSATIQVSTEMMSVEFPDFDYDGTFQYTDANSTLLFDSSQSQDDMVDVVREKLSAAGWKATTDAPIKISFRNHLIFRNPAQEYLEATFQKIDDKTRVNLKFQNAKQFAAAEERAKKTLESK